MKFLSVAGTVAMFLVGGGILMHGIGPLHHALAAWVAPMATILGALVENLANASLGVAVGAIVLGAVTLGSEGLFVEAGCHWKALSRTLPLVERDAFGFQQNALHLIAARIPMAQPQTDAARELMMRCQGIFTPRAWTPTHARRAASGAGVRSTPRSARTLPPLPFGTRFTIANRRAKIVIHGKMKLKGLTGVFRHLCSERLTSA